jgi:hypothetical protein
MPPATTLLATTKQTWPSKYTRRPFSCSRTASNTSAATTGIAYNIIQYISDNTSASTTGFPTAVPRATPAKWSASHVLLLYPCSRSRLVAPGQNVGGERGSKPVAHARCRHPLPKAFAAAQSRSGHDIHRPRQQSMRCLSTIAMRSPVLRTLTRSQAAPRLRDADVSQDKWPQLYSEVRVPCHPHAAT